MEIQKQNPAIESKTEFLKGSVVKTSLPQFHGRPSADAPRLKRLMLEQGELAQFWDGPESIHYMAFLELRRGSVRGNHFHHRKVELFYLISGEVLLLVEEPDSGKREEIILRPGDLVRIQSGVAHAYKVTKEGQALEFAEVRFDAADLHPHPMG